MRTFLLKPSILLLPTLALHLCAAELDLEQQFQSPPESARPRTWWHWVSGNVSAEGITADLAAMKEIGLGGCQLFTVDQSNVRGPVKFMSPEWRGFVKQALGEADKLGLEISIEGCDGWSESGGPWIQPEQGMQHVVWTEKHVTGGGKVLLDLPQPSATRGFYKDIALLAFPMLQGDDLPLPAELKCSLATVDGHKLIDGAADTAVQCEIVRNSPLDFELSYRQPVTCGSVTITGDVGLAKVMGELYVSADGSEFKKVGAIQLVGVSTFPTATGTHFRLKFPKVSARQLRLAEIGLSGARLDQAQALVGMQPKLNLPFTELPLPADQVINPAKIIDLTGKSHWNAPPGRWTLIRIGHTGTGATTHPSTTPGLECDKLSRTAVRYHLEQMYGPVMADAPEQVGRALRYILLDSWECGCANWTPLMPREFSKRRGYDLTRWLPTFTGRVVKDAEATQKFLWDFRHTISDLLTENHYGETQKFAREHHMGLYAEGPGIGLPTVADNLACKGRTDIPMGEFWINRSMDDNIDDPKEAASAAHIYGKPIVATESFTATANVASWANDPYGLKRLGDMEFCLGVNRFVFHRYAHQPWNDRQPGMSMGPWGINFERSNTWWKQGAAWMDYLSRCQYLLQQGRFVADLLYFYGEGATTGFAHRNLKPAVPEGYDYDVCNAEILLQHASVDHGEIVLQSGMRYRVLVLPENDRMTLALLTKIQSLVRAGATVYGPKPLKSPSLKDRDAAVQKVATQVWGDCDGSKVTTHNYGKGRVLWGAPLTAALPSGPDFSAAESALKFIHRRVGDAEVYFVSNQRQVARTVDCTFRINGKMPELWQPDTGQRKLAALYWATNGATTVPIHFDPVGSVFVIFRQNAAINHVVALARDGKPLAPMSAAKPEIEIQSATFGVPGDATQSRDVTAEIKQLLGSGNEEVAASDLLKGGDPAVNIVKTLTVNYRIGGDSRTGSALEGETLNFATAQTTDAAPLLWYQDDGSLQLQTFVPGRYEITLASGKTLSATVTELPAPLAVAGEWQLSFPPKLGAPATATFARLISWPEAMDEGVKYFSGTATYRKTVEIPAAYFGAGKQIMLDLGTVKNLATISVNGKSLGTLWKEPFQVDLTTAAKPGANELEIQVVNLWPNRMIGDQKLPESQRITWASVAPYKAGDSLLPSGLLGPVRIAVAQQVDLGQ